MYSTMFVICSLSWLVILMSDSWPLPLQPTLLQASTLKEYCVWGSNMVTLYVTALPLDMTSLELRLATSKGLPLAVTLRMYKMNLWTGLLPSKVRVHLTTIHRGPASIAARLSGVSGFTTEKQYHLIKVHVTCIRYI